MNPLRCCFHASVWLTAGFCSALAASSSLSEEPDDFGNLDLEELSKVKIISATLTPTTKRLVPAASASMDGYVVMQSGARTLNELLEVSATNTQLIFHNGHLEHLGVRGIISDREDKYLLRVNGRVMNNRFLVGAESERDLPLLGDLREVTLLYGPGSATYGAGALSGVLNLETYDGLSFQGSDFHFRQALGDQFSAAEWRFGRKTGSDSGVFIYAGVAVQDGATQSDAPMIFGRDFATPGGAPDVKAGEPVSFSLPNVHDGAGVTKAKLHADYTSGAMRLWLRYTQSAGVVRPMRSTLETTDMSAASKGRGNKDRQLSAVAELRPRLSGSFSLESSLSYGFYEHVYALYDLFSDPLDRHEDEVALKVLGSWTRDPNQSLALGIEYFHNWFRGPRLSIPPVNDKWETNALSVMAEHQWRIGNQWTVFTSGRTDAHTYTTLLFSPRAALVYTPTANDTLKFIVARAARRSGEGELREEHVQKGTKGDIETLKSVEIRYEKQFDVNRSFGCSAFLQDNHAIGYNSAINRSLPLGNFKVFGIEPEFMMRSGKNRLLLSHAYTKLASASLDNPSTIQGISALPYGFGRDLASWSNHITKLSLIREFTRQWTFSASLRQYWDYQGARDLARWNASRAAPTNYALSDPGYEQSYRGCSFLNLGLSFQASPNWLLRLDACNALGWADRKLNKRIYITRGSEYSTEAATLVFSFTYTFEKR